MHTPDRPNNATHLMTTAEVDVKSSTVKISPPTWQYAVEIYMIAIEDGIGAGKEAAKDEIRRMARILDDQAKNS